MFNDILYKDKLIETLKRIVLKRKKFDFISDCSEHKNILMEKVLDLSLKLALKIHLRELNRSVKKKVFNLKKLRDIIKKRKVN